jgi:hypothetical protein
MKYLIDFSIFDSPTHAYGNVTGELEFSYIPQLGEEVGLLDNLALKVTSVSCVHGVEEKFLIGLEDIVYLSQPMAEHIGKRLESELGLFCVVYDEF